jgi:hypothetical protein
MKYLLIANNDAISSETIEKLEISNDDLIILFNRQYPLKFDKIRKHHNKIVFICNQHGAEEIIKNHSLYRKIYYRGTLKECPWVNEIKKNPESNQKLSELSPIHKTVLEKLEKDVYPEKKIFDKEKGITRAIGPQTGFLVYLYVKHCLMSDQDKVYLIGFTGKYKYRNALLNWHDIDFEQNYYQKEKKNYPNLVKIDK